MKHSINPLSLKASSGTQAVAHVESLGRVRSGRLKMLVILIICALPVVGSYLAYYFIKPRSTRSYGELITPIRPMPDVLAKRLDGHVVKLHSLKNQWLLLGVDSGSCDLVCEKRLRQQRQLREMLGREKDRLDWVWLIKDEAVLRPQLAAVLERLGALERGGFQTLRVKQEELQGWLGAGNGAGMTGEYLYLIDPMGNYMMRFPSGIQAAEAGRIKRDIERVLRASHSWDKPGR